MKRIVVILADDGRMHVDVDLPEGEECDTVDLQLRAVLVALGVTDVSTVSAPRRPPLPVEETDANAEKVKG